MMWHDKIINFPNQLLDFAQSKSPMHVPSGINAVANIAYTTAAVAHSQAAENIKHGHPYQTSHSETQAAKLSRNTNGRIMDLESIIATANPARST